jgi:hypothetical protein
MLKTSVSFFNEVASESKNYPQRPMFHFLMRLPQRRKKLSSEMQKTNSLLDHGFQEDNAPE